MTEQQIQKKITTTLEKEGCYVVKVVSASKAGVPDILACYKGVFLGIEVKKPTTQGDVSKLQRYNLRRIVDCGGYSIVAWDVDIVKDLLKRIDNDTLKTSN